MEKGILGNAIRNARIEKRLSQEALAEAVNITPTHLKHIEGEHRKPSVEVLWALAQKLDLSLDNLLFPAGSDSDALRREAANLLGQCDEKQLKILLAAMRAMLEE